MRRSSIGPAAVVLAVATTGSAMVAWTALASPGSGAAAPGAISQHGSISKQGNETNNCANYVYKNGRLVRVSDTGNSAASCSASANGSSGADNSGGNNGGATGTPGTEVNNCVPASSCSASAKGTSGRSD